MTKFLKKFVECEDGAVTVDWVVLTAAIVGLSVITISSITSGTNDLGEKVSDHVAQVEVGGK